MYILDTHTLLWFFDGDERLSSQAKDIIQTEDNVYVSIVSFWEIAIKQSIKKLELENSPSELITLAEQQAINILQISPKHLDMIKTLKKIHNDPFDRLIVAQAQCEDMTIITKDLTIPKYKVKILW
ncbi:hypothetical protein HMPREF9194_00563 [Treponema maltophilum ATCC 51939]|uniref:PIN domain-containing protein n=1 Tax=Treponema maltophilum ATCC 51939 TaxID=1125699 RepID=S3L0J5_TREMA|nr:type II toxin-antitoxin system VapC family toxin [Treponema maltophilum]EPF30249.1 hypothetical protein HMPREF9194_00563 [Treponema maltophilum ATCC 51939]